MKFTPTLAVLGFRSVHPQSLLSSLPIPFLTNTASHQPRNRPRHIRHRHRHYHRDCCHVRRLLLHHLLRRLHHPHFHHRHVQQQRLTHLSKLFLDLHNHPHQQLRFQRPAHRQSLNLSPSLHIAVRLRRRQVSQQHNLSEHPGGHRHRHQQQPAQQQQQHVRHHHHQQQHVGYMHAAHPQGPFVPHGQLSRHQLDICILPYRLRDFWHRHRLRHLRHRVLSNYCSAWKHAIDNV